LKRAKGPNGYYFITNIPTVLEICVFASSAKEFPDEEELVAADFQDSEKGAHTACEAPGERPQRIIAQALVRSFRA
jgi:hypothetical protein